MGERVVRAARLPSSLGLCRAKPATSAPLFTIEGRERNYESLSCFVLRLCVAVNQARSPLMPVSSNPDRKAVHFCTKQMC